MRSSVFKIAGVLAANDPGLSLGPRTLRSSLAIEVMKAVFAGNPMSKTLGAKCRDNFAWAGFNCRITHLVQKRGLGRACKKDEGDVVDSACL